MPNDAPVRLQLFMARCGVASRRACEQYIASGRVRVNGRVVTEQGVKVLPGDDVSMDGRRIRPVTKRLYIALNKPQGYLCANSDPKGRPLAVDLLRDRHGERLFSVGRLDFLSSGLILFTNDGAFARSVGHPSSRVEKEYLVETKLPVPIELLERFKRGVEIEGVRYSISSYGVRSSTRITLVLVEGKNREIRRLFYAHNIDVRRVHRIRIGGVGLGTLKSGEHRTLSDAEVASLLRERPARGRTARGRRD